MIETKILVEYDRQNRPLRLVWLDASQTYRVIGRTEWKDLAEPVREAALRGEFPCRTQMWP